MSKLNIILKEIFLLTCATILSLTLIPLTFVIIVPFCVVKFFVRQLAPVIRPDLDQLLSIESALFTRDLFSPKPPRCSLVVKTVADGHVSLDEARKIFGEMCAAKDEETGNILYPQYSQYPEQWCGYHFWKDDPNFNIVNHVKAHKKFGRRDSVSPEDISRLMEDLLNERYPLQKSPWEMIVVNNYKDDDDTGSKNYKTVFLARVHHILGDGYSIIFSVFEGALKTSMSQVQLPAPKMSTSKRKMISFILKFPFCFISDLAHYFLSGLPDHRWKIPDSKKIWRQYYGKSRPIPIEKIKDIKNEFDVAFSSVIISAVSAGLTKMTSHRKEKGGDSDDGLMLMPIPLPRHPNALKFHITSGNIAVPLNNVEDSIQRLRKCDARLKGMIKSVVPFVIHRMSPVFGQLPSAIYPEVLNNHITIGGITILPVGGNEIRIGVGNSKVDAVEFIAGAFPGVSGVVFSGISYEKHFQFAATVEGGLLSRNEVDHLMQLVEDEIHSLHRSLSSKGKPKSNSVAIDYAKRHYQ